MLGQIDQNKKRSKLDKGQNCRIIRGGYSRLRMVHTGFNIRFQHNTLLRRHLSRPESNSEVLPLLDEHGLLRDIHSGNGPQMDSPRLRQVLHQLLDHLRLYNCFRKLT